MQCRCRRSPQRTARGVSTLTTGPGTSTENSEPSRDVAGRRAAALEGYDDIVQQIYAASLDLHAALAAPDGHRATDRIQLAINGLDDAITTLRLLAAWPLRGPPE